MSKQISPLPWGFDKYGTVVEADGRTTIRTQGFALSSSEEAEANAAFIVKAVNSHDKLVAALKFYANTAAWDDFRSDEQAAAFDRNMGSVLGDDWGEIARAALAAAGEGHE